MADRFTSMISEEERAARHVERAANRKKKLRARRRKRMKQIFPVAAFSFLLIGLFVLWKIQSIPSAPETPTEEEINLPVASMPELSPEDLPDGPYSAEGTVSTVSIGDTIDSSYAVVLDVANESILAEKAANTKINPASMTKVLTLLVAAEHLTESDLDETFTITIEITDYCFVNGCSVVGLEVGETISVREMLYGCILPSGADASLGLANYVAGSHESFVELMNQKLTDLGLSETSHFTNCVGLYDENHYCTVYDMAMILKAAMDNELCREVLNARTYDTAPTEFHPEGQTLSNWFLRRIEDRFTEDFQIVGGKTGYVVQSGNCAASAGRDKDGHLYITVTGDASSSWRAIYDHTDLYQTYCV